MFPLLAIPLAIYNLLAIFGVPMTVPFLWISPTIALSCADIIVVATLVLLSVEIWRSAAPTPQTAKNHVAGLMLLLLCVLELVVAPWCKSGLFVELTFAAAVDLVIGTYVSFALKGGNVWVSNR